MLRLALIGCGRISKNHFEAIKSFDQEAQIVGVCDSDPQTLTSVSESLSVPGYSNFSAMIDETSADLVSICSPSGLHVEHALEVLRQNKHVLIEKPMALDLVSAQKLVLAAQSNSKKVFVVKQNRLNSTIQLLKTAIDQGRFGKIYFVSINVFWTRPQSYYDSATWRSKTGGGAFLNQASHYVDLLDWLVGPVDSLQSYTATLAREIEDEDTGAVSLRWKSGALGNLGVTMLTHQQNFEGSMTIVGEKGTVRIGGVAVNEIQKWEFANPQPQDKQIEMANYKTTSVYGKGHKQFYRRVFDVLAGLRFEVSNQIDGYRNVELLCAIQESSKKNGQRIFIENKFFAENR